MDDIEIPVPLLPPSCFETPRKSETLRSIAELSKELLRVKNENDKLREQLTTVNQAKVSSNTLPSAQYEIAFAHDLIGRQSAEINELKKKLLDLETSCRYEITKVENQRAMEQSQSLQQITILKGQLEEQSRKYANDISKKDNEMLESKNLLNEQLALSKQTVEDLRGQLTETVKTHQAALAAKNSSALEKEKEFENVRLDFEVTLREKVGKIAELEVVIHQLKGLLTESQENIKSSDCWRREMTALKSRLEVADKEKLQYEKTIDLLNIRLSAQAEIIQGYENETGKFGDGLAEKKRIALLSRWRNKVYSLLVQLKSSSIIQKELESNFNRKITEVQGDLKAATLKNELMHHSMEDKDALLQLRQQEILQLKNTVSSHIQEKAHLSSQMTELTLLFKNTEEKAKITAEELKRFSNCFSNSLTTLHVYGQRISFVCNRLEILQSQMIRLKSKYKLRQKDSDDVANTTQIPKESHWNHLVVEIERLTSERNQLADQLKHDAQLLEERITAAVEKYASETELLKTRCKELHEMLEIKEQECRNTNFNLEQIQRNLDESNKTIDELRQNLYDQQLTLSTVVDDLRKNHEIELAEQLAEVELRLNEARREHTKAAVAVQQLERQLLRERELTVEKNTALELEYRKTVEKLEQQLKSSESDRNLLMATIRQEGLINKYKAARKGPITSPRLQDQSIVPITSPRLQDQSTVFNSEANDHVKQVPDKSYASALPASTQPLNEMMKDLQVLAATLLEDS